MPVIRIIDVTNRDGVQTSRIGLAKLQKTMINVYLNELGVFQSEFGFPFTRHETNYINANLELVDKGLIDPMVLSGWCRGVVEDVAGCIKMTETKNLNISSSTSNMMIKGKFGGKKTGKEVCASMAETLRYAKENGMERVGVNSEDASRTDIDFLIEFAGIAKENGADRIRYCDTLGFDDPMTIYDRVNKLAKAVQIPIELHTHNDLGMAVGCSIAGALGAIDAGVDAYINTCVNGVGERAGNADLASVIFAVIKSSGVKDRNLLDSRIDTTKLWKLGKYAAYAFGLPISINQVAIGRNAFAHESGIHADGALKDRHMYELYSHEEVGRGEAEIIETGTQITTGAYGGIKGFRNVYDKIEIEFKDDKEATEILELVRYANVHTQLPLTDGELKFIANHPDQARKILTVTLP